MILAHCPACRVPLALVQHAPVVVVTQGELGVCAGCAAVFVVRDVTAIPFATTVATDADVAALPEDARVALLASVAHVLRSRKETRQ